MLKAVSFKREIIFAASGSPSTGHNDDAHYDRIGQLDMPLQLYDELRSMGYEHFLLVGQTTSRICEAIKPLRPTLSCVWDSVDYSRAGLGLLHYKMMFIARAVRAGYNVMALDADVILFQEPYHSLKNTPILRDSHFICIKEGGSAYNCNAGFMCAQNADPTGPVAWVWYDIIRTILQRVDDEGHNSRFCSSYDQVLILDSLASAAAGLPLHLETLRTCSNDPAQTNKTFSASNGQILTSIDVIRNMDMIRFDRSISSTSILPTKEWLDDFSVTSFNTLEKEFFFGNLTVPNLRFGLPELGGSDFRKPLGPFASIWMQTLLDDNPTAPWFNEYVPLSPEDEKKLALIFPDPKDHTKMAQVSSLPHNLFHPSPRVDRKTTELFAHVPHWLAHSIQARAL